jgi:hypothetical protein
MSTSARASRVSVFAALAGFAAIQAGAAAAVPAKSEDGKPYIGGVWLVEKPQAQARTVAGTPPPLRPQAAEVYAKRKQAKASGKNAGDPVEECLPHGVPRLLSATRPIHILQKPKQITVLYEANHQARLFYIDEPLPAPASESTSAPDPTYNGYSVARWVGNTLVVDTIAMNDKTWLDDVGLPHSEALRLVERYELADPGRLRVTVTVTDPETFTAPWEMQLTFKRRPDLRLQENACAEKLWQPGAGEAG